MTKNDSSNDSDPVLDHGFDEDSLDFALQRCLESLESDSGDINTILAQFPKWRHELEAFVENWLGVEKAASKLASPIQGKGGDKESIKVELADYELLEQIGAGGMGVVYKARQLSLNRIVALKMIAGPDRDRERFRMEAEAAAGMSHANIVSIYEIGDYEHDQMFFSMQLIDGDDLKEYLNKRNVSIREAAEISEIIARAVHYAHQRGILHRDLKPANILMDAAGQPHITDFGLAKQIGRDTEITRSGTIMGTPGYMAPEQASGSTRNMTTATDVYGIGAILYTMLTGHAPFHGDSPLEVLHRVISEQAPSPRVGVADIHRDLETICLKCLEKSPDLRYGSAALLADDLNRYLTNRPVVARPISSGERVWRWCRRNPAIAILSGAVMLLLLATVVATILLSVSQNLTKELSNRVGGIEKSEKRALELVDRTRTNLFVANGMLLANQANLGEAALWFSNAARISKGDRKQYNANIVRYTSWMKNQPDLIAALWLKDAYKEVEVSRSKDRIEFRPGHPQLLIEAGNERIVWNYSSGEKWALDETFPDIATSSWDFDGERIAVAETTGNVTLLEATTRGSLFKFQSAEDVTSVKFSKSGKMLVVASPNTVEIWDLESKQRISNSLKFSRSVAYAGFGSNEKQLVVQNGMIASVYQIDSNELSEAPIKHLFDVESFAGRANEGRRTFWPTFVNDDSWLAVKTSRRSFSLHDTNDGTRIAFIESERDMYSVSISDDGTELIVAGYNDAEWMTIGEVEPTESPRRDEDVTKTNDTETFTWTSLHRLRHQGRVTTTGFGANELVATGSWDHSVRLWSKLESEDPLIPRTENARHLVSLPHQRRVRQLGFSCDGSCMATVQVDGLIRVWKVPAFHDASFTTSVSTKGSLANVIDSERWMTRGVSQHSSNARDLQFFRFDDVEEQNEMTLKLAEYGPIMDARILNGELVVSAHANTNRGSRTWGATDGTAGALRIWALSTAKSYAEPISMPSEPRSIALNHDSSRLAVCTAKMEVVLIDTSDFSVIETLIPTDRNGNKFVPKSLRPTHQFNQQLCFGPAGNEVVAWSSTTEGVWVWDLKEKAQKYPMIQNDGWPVNTVEFSPSSQSIVIAGGRSTVARVIDIESGKDILPELKHFSAIYTARFSPDGKQIVTACRDGRARVYDSQSGDLVFGNLTHEADVVDAKYTPDSQWILTLGSDRRLMVWDAKDGSAAMKPFETSLAARQILISPDSRYVVVGGGGQDIPVFDIGKPRQFSKVASDLERAISLSELLSNKTLSDDGSTEKLTTDHWYDRWLKYSRR